MAGAALRNNPKSYEYKRVEADPITFEVIHHRLISISDEQAATLAAISGSPLVNDASDFNTGIFRTNGEIVTLGKTVLFHAASVAEMIKHIIKDCEDNPGIRSGDMFIVNNPYKGALHQPDFGIVAPVFYDGQRIAWIGVCAHQLDVGAGVGTEATDVFAEGMLISPVKVVENDEIRHDVLSMILGMSRMPTNLSLDFRGMIAANRVASKRLHETIDQYGIDAVLSVIDGAIELSEQAVRKRLRELPDGVYRSQKYLDHDGTENKLFRVHVEMTKKDDSLILDFSKSADQSRRFMNSTESGMLAGIRAALLPILAYDVPWNEGVFNPMKVIAREGSIVSAKFPAPVSQGPLGAMWLVEMVVTEALSLMMATNSKSIVEAQAAPNGGPDGFSVHGVNQHGEQTHGSFLDQIYVGGGAYFDHDGLSPQGHRHIPAIRLQNVERNESHAPVMYMYRKFIPDTGGPGRHRGGISVGHAYVLHKSERMQTRFACHCYESPISTGMFGGYPAACNTRRMLKNASVRKSIDAGRIPYDTTAITGDLQHLPAKIKGGIDFTKDDYHEATPSAGGGWGDPIERDAALVAEDVRTNAVSAEAAREIYGVVVAADGSFDSRATEVRRVEMRAERLSWPQKKMLSNAPNNGAPGDVLALFGDRAKFVRVAGRNYLRCDCGCAMAPADENWKDYARQANTTAVELGPRIALHEELEAIRYACPSCARLHWVEIKLKNEDALYDMELSSVGLEQTMPEHILPLPPKWERDLDCGWVVFKSGPDDIRGYLAKPKGARGLPGIVMLHENLGVIEHRQDVTRRLAKAGFAAITVDLYSRIGGQSPRDFKTPQERRIKASLANPDEQGVGDAEAACRYLESMDEVDRDRIGAIGYCSGGGTLYSWLCGQSTNVKAAVCFYGTVVTDSLSRADGKPLDRAEKAHLLRCPIQIHHGDVDRAVDISESQRMVAALKKSGQPVEAHIYAGADHAYHDDTHPHHHVEASALSWTRTIDFLNRHLMGASEARAAAG